MKQVILVLIFLALVVCMIAAASVTDNVARTNEYQAFVEMGRAMQVSSAGNLASITWLGAIAALLLVVVIVLLVALLRRGSGKRQDRRDSSHDAQQLPGKIDPMTAMLMTMLMQQMRQLPPRNNALPHESTFYSLPEQKPVDDDINAPWWS